MVEEYDSIMDELTVDESLEFFANIKGVAVKDRKFQIKFIKSSLDLHSYSKIRAGTLSGGNKRKLCLGMALIGCPSMLFLDEPTRGVDPVSRRYLMKLLK